MRTTLVAGNAGNRRPAAIEAPPIPGSPLPQPPARVRDPRAASIRLPRRFCAKSRQTSGSTHGPGTAQRSFAGTELQGRRGSCFVGPQASAPLSPILPFFHLKKIPLARSSRVGGGIELILPPSEQTSSGRRGCEVEAKATEAAKGRGGEVEQLARWSDRFTGEAEAGPRGVF